MTISPRPPENFERIGRTSGEACGTLLFYSTIYSFVPVMLNSRVERAYDEALRRVPSATGLVNTELTESWFWWVIGTTICTQIEGHAVRAAPAESATP